MALAQYSDTWWFPNSRTAGCTLVKVFPVDSNIPANLYADSCGGHKLPNPLRTSELGVLTFWAEEGKYWIHIDGRTFPITVGEAGCVTPQDLDCKFAEHVQAADPHGDRAAANAALMHHAACTKSVHGIVDTGNLETKDGAQRKANEAIDQALCQVQAKIDQHAAQTTNVHGICDTAELETRNGAQQKAYEAVESAVMIAGEKAEQIARDAVRDELDGWEPGGKFETPEGAQAKADRARDDAVGKAAEAAEAGDAELQKQIDALKDGGTPTPEPTPEPGGGVTEERAKEIADAAAKAGDEPLDERIKALEDATPAPGGGVSETRAEEIADAAAKKAADGAAQKAEECCKANADAIKAGDDALDKRVKALEADGGGTPTPTPTPTPEPGEWETPEGAQAKADKAAADAVAAHVKSCHTLSVVKGGVTPIADADRERNPDADSGGSWEDDGSEMRTIGGVRHVFIRVKRVGGAYLPTKGEAKTTGHALDFASDADADKGYEGGPEAGNVVPDCDFLQLDDAWVPPQSFKVSAHSSFGSGSVIIFKGKVYLLDWMVNNVIQTGHKVAFEYEFLTKSPCEEDGSGGGETPAPEPTEEPAPGGEVSQEALAKALAAYPSAYAGSDAKSVLEAKEWSATAAGELSVTVKVPPSRKMRVTTAMRALNGTSGLSQAHQAVRITRGKDVVVEAGDFPVVTLSHIRLRETDAASRTFHVDFAEVADGRVKAGDEITVSVHNRSTVGKTEVLDRDVAVESLLA